MKVSGNYENLGGVPKFQASMTAVKCKQSRKNWRCDR